MCKKVLFLFSEAPNIKYQTLTARILPTATLVAGTWHGQLACGFFYAVGTAFTVVWKVTIIIHHDIESNQLFDCLSFDTLMQFHTVTVNAKPYMIARALSFVDLHSSYKYVCVTTRLLCGKHNVEVPNEALTTMLKVTILL